MKIRLGIAGLAISVILCACSKVPAQSAVSVTKHVGDPITFSWTAPTSNTDGTPIVDPLTYTLYTVNGASYTQVQAGIVGTTVQITAQTVGITCYVLTAVDTQVLTASAPSAPPVCVQVEAANAVTPNPPGGVTGS